MPATSLPALPPTVAPTLALNCLHLEVPDRLVPLQLRISAPVHGTGLPVLLISHGHGPSNYVSSLYGYAPVADHFRPPQTNLWVSHLGSGRSPSL